MKKIKNTLCMLLVMAIIMSLSVTTFAATPLKYGSLTVSGAQLSGKDVTIVRMFTASVDDKNGNNIIDKNDTIAYELDSVWKEFFNQKVTSKEEENVTSEEAYNYVAGKNEQDLVAFAKDAKTYYNANTSKFDGLVNTQKANENNTVNFDKLNTGYYLVLPENGSTNPNRTTDAMIVNIPGEKASNLELKTEYPAVEKTVGNDSSHGNSAQIGDDVKFLLTSNVPNMEDYSKYIFSFNDTLSNGLTLNSESVKVTIGGNSLQNDTDYKKIVNNNTNDTVLRVEFSNLKSVVEKYNCKAGDEIKVEYTATLNENANITNSPNTNKAEVEYSNKPGTNETGKSESSITNTYTFDIKVHKYANNDESKILPGAEFQLQTADGTLIKLVKKNETTYRVANSKEVDNVVDTFITVETGYINIKGLKEGIYKLKEINPPVGYNKLTKPVEIQIKVQYNLDGSIEKNHPQYIVNGKEPSQENVVKIQNKNGAFLPETGSIGTIGLTALGIAVVIAGLCFAPRKKKEQK